MESELFKPTRGQNRRQNAVSKSPFITMHAKGIQLVFFSGLTKEVGVDSYCFPSQIYPPPPFWLMSHTTYFFYFSCVTFEQLKAQSATMYLFHFIRNILFTRLSHSLAKKYAPL